MRDVSVQGNATHLPQSKLPASCVCRLILVRPALTAKERVNERDPDADAILEKLENLVRQQQQKQQEKQEQILQHLDKKKKTFSTPDTTGGNSNNSGDTSLSSYRNPPASGNNPTRYPATGSCGNNDVRGNRPRFSSEALSATFQQDQEEPRGERGTPQQRSQKPHHVVDRAGSGPGDEWRRPEASSLSPFQASDKRRRMRTIPSQGFLTDLSSDLPDLDDGLCDDVDDDVGPEELHNRHVRQQSQYVVQDEEEQRDHDKEGEDEERMRMADSGRCVFLFSRKM